jgi:hypothetical protein
MSVSLEEVAQDLKDMNNNAQALLEKYNNAGTKLDTKIILHQLQLLKRQTH